MLRSPIRKQSCKAVLASYRTRAAAAWKVYTKEIKQMRSLKTKFASLGLAFLMLGALAGCAMSAPATVGTIGGVEIPAGVYLLCQYNAYNTASGLADLATGETASDVKAVLKAQCTGTIDGEEVTASGSEYVQKLTTRSIEYYAAVEKQFEELGGVLDDAATAEAASTADSLWSSNGDLYTANGIGKKSLETYLLNAQKARAILELRYGENGQDPVTSSDMEEYIQKECRYIEMVQLPLLDMSTYAFATQEQKTEIQALADACVEELNAATSESAVYDAAMTYVPQASAILGGSVDEANALYYAYEQLFTPDDLAGYDSEDGNTMCDPLDAAGEGVWTRVDLPSAVLVARKIDALESVGLEDLKNQYDLLTDMRSTQLQEELYAAGAELEHSLNQSALNTYSASKIKKSV